MASIRIERSLYNGKYQMVHNPNARGRTPRYLVNSEHKPKGVTTILGKTLYKDLIQWAANCVVDYLAPKLPVITEKDLEEGRTAYARLRDKGASTGSEAHELVELYLKAKIEDKEFKPGTASPEALNAFNAFVEWFNQAKPSIVGVEEVVYSESHKYAGTYDCMLEVDGKIFLCDLKTTNASKQAPKGVYPEHFLQLGAYALAHEEQRLYEEANGGTDLLKIDDLMVISAKKNGKLDIITASELSLQVEECGNMFKRVVNIHNFVEYASTKLGG